VLLAVAQGEQPTAAARSIQRWRAAYHAAEVQYGCGYLGLLDRVAARGNRTPRAPEASVQLLDTYLQNHYATPQAKRAAAVYRLYREACTQQGLAPVSERTFYRVRARDDARSDRTTSGAARGLRRTAFLLASGSDHAPPW
jgi:putative transposase